MVGGPPPAGAVFWLEEARERQPDAAACPPLVRSIRADVCIVGAGYLGLWTALELKRRSPDLRIVLIEAEASGFGASGRNGGWVTSWYDELDGLVDKFGAAEALWLGDESSASIRRIGEFVAAEEIECDFRQKGTIWVARSPQQLSVIEAAARACREAGRADRISPLAPAQIEAMTGVRPEFGGVLIDDSASVQPALLCAGLRRVALERGVEIYEGTRMVGLERARPAVVRTPAGRIEADRVVLATNAWTAQMVRELRRAIVVVGTQIVLTEPIPGRVPEPWREGALLGDARLFVHYAQVTHSERIAFGRGGGAIGPFGRVLAKHFADDETARSVAADFHGWFPGLAAVPITHAWGGPVDRAPGHLPFVGSLGPGNIWYGLGFSGNGVGPSELVARILASSVLEAGDRYSSCALTGGPPGYLPPEPARIVGGALIRTAVRRTEEREERCGRGSAVGSVAKSLVPFKMPAPVAFARRRGARR